MRKFNWNDAVKMKSTAPDAYLPGRGGAIIGDEPWEKDGIMGWTVELGEAPFGDVHVPEEYLTLIETMDWSPWQNKS